MIIELLLGLACLLGYSYWYLQRRWAYWASVGVNGPPASFPFGNSPFFHKDLNLRRKNIIHIAREQYQMFKNERLYGVYMLGAPQLVITDPDVMKQIMVKDFSHFVSRNDPGVMLKALDGKSRTDQMWRKMLIFLDGEEWKDMRSAFSPIFTSGKMKSMMPFIHEVNEQLLTRVRQKAEDGGELDLKDHFGKFTMDSIASCAFGVDAGAFKDENSEFVKYARMIFRQNVKEGLVIMLKMLPLTGWLMGVLGVSVLKPEPTRFFHNVVTKVLEQRLKTKVRRNDLIDLMIDAMRNENIGGETDKEDSQDQFDLDSKLAYTRKTTGLTGEKREIDQLAIISNAFIILVAGYDTTAQTLSYAGYELAKNPAVQRRLQEEIDRAVDEAGSGNNAIDYAVVQNLDYLDMVLHETLRKYPAFGAITRACSEDYVLKVPGCPTVNIPKGMEVHMNVGGVLVDPEFFPDPDKFDPERFSKENKAKRHPYAYLGFGAGPRSCMGMRFAMLEAKVALASILVEFNLVPSENTPESTDFDPQSQLGACKEKLVVNVQKRHS